MLTWPLSPEADYNNMSVSPDSGAESKSTNKTVYFIRHGESEYNAYKSRTSTWLSCRCWCCCDPNFQDPRLSAKGKSQVEGLKTEVARLQLDTSVQVIYVSPLSRAIDTCLGAWPGNRPQIVVSELISEVMDTLGDVGRPPEELSLEYPVLSFDKLPKAWWFYDETKGPLTPVKEPATFLKKRQERFLQELAGRAESTIAVVGHSAFIKHITASNSKLPNCGIMRASLNVSTMQLSDKEIIFLGTK